MEEFKRRVKDCMVQHLKTKGWPDNITNEEIMIELKPMWIKLEEAGLLKPGMSYNTFVDKAHFQFMVSEFSSQEF